MSLSLAEERVAPSAQDREASLAHEASDTSIEVRDDGTSIVVSRGGAWLCRARARVESLPARNLGLGGRLLILDEFAASQPNVLDSDSRGALPVLRDLFRSAKTNTKRPWHVLRVDARSDQNAVVGAAWRFALEWDMACNIEWSADDIISVFLYGHGTRAAVARLARSVFGLRSVANLPNQSFAAVHRSLRRSRRPNALLLGLDLKELTTEDAPPQVTFRSASPSAVARRPLLYADTVHAAEVLLMRAEECIVGETHGRTVFRTWAGALEAGWLEGVEPSLAAKPSRYLHEGHTIEEFRNRGIYTAGLRWAAARFRSQGYEMLYLHVMPDNHPAIRSDEKVGFRVMIG